MNFKSLLLLASIALFGMISCSAPAEDQTPAPDMAKIKFEIQAMENAYAAGLAAKDANAVVAYYAEDAVNMPDDEPVVTGKKAILDRLTTNIAKDTSGSTEVFEVQDLIATGNYLIEAGKSTTTNPSGKITTGKYISIFEKRDGKYVCIRDMWNADAPSRDE